MVAQLGHPPINDMRARIVEHLVGQRSAVDAYREDTGRSPGPDTQRRVLDDDSLPWVQSAGLPKSHQVWGGMRLAPLHVVCRHDMVFGEIIAKVANQPFYQWFLPASGNHVDAHAMAESLLHHLYDAIEDRRFGHVVEYMGLDIVHFLRLFERNFLPFLRLHEVPYRVDTRAPSVA